MASKDHLHDFVRGEHWAVVGASEDRSKFGNITFRELQRRGKHVSPVNPRAAEIEGEPCYPDLTALPAPVDRVLVVVPPALGEQVVRDAATAGVNRIWFQPGAESEAALALSAELGIEAIAGHCILQTTEENTRN